MSSLFAGLPVTRYRSPLLIGIIHSRSLWLLRWPFMRDEAASRVCLFSLRGQFPRLTFHAAAAILAGCCEATFTNRPLRGDRSRDAFFSAPEIGRGRRAARTSDSILVATTSRPLRDHFAMLEINETVGINALWIEHATVITFLFYFKYFFI